MIGIYIGPPNSYACRLPPLLRETSLSGIPPVQQLIQDAGSTNGSYVNDQRVESTSLAPGDRLLIGKFHLVVAHGDG